MSILSQIQNDQMVTSEVPFEKKFCSGGTNQIADAHYHGQLLLGGWCCQAATRKLHLCSSAVMPSCGLVSSFYIIMMEPV